MALSSARCFENMVPPKRGLLTLLCVICLSLGEPLLIVVLSPITNHYSYFSITNNDRNDLLVVYVFLFKNSTCLWVGQKNSLGFSVTSYGNTQTGFLANPILIKVGELKKNYS